MSLAKAIKHKKENRHSIRFMPYAKKCSPGKRCGYCSNNLLYSTMHRIPVVEIPDDIENVEIINFIDITKVYSKHSHHLLHGYFD